MLEEEAERQRGHEEEGRRHEDTRAVLSGVPVSPSLGHPQAALLATSEESVPGPKRKARTSPSLEPHALLRSSTRRRARAPNGRGPRGVGMEAAPTDSLPAFG